jgi:L-threonylcarbamoyladenylate synthase
MTTMNATQVLRIDAARPEPHIIARAADILRRGGLIAFPTETVYGLGANALDPAAVGRIFAAKGRPSSNPLIVHVAGAADARTLVTDWPETADRLAVRFWPGPLTLVLPRSAIVPDVVTAGGSTVAIRSPAHPVARALIQTTGLPLAAPSANPAARVSATRAEHVLAGLGGRIELILDAGPTPGGIESTVLDLTTTPPRLLRPGLVLPADIEQVIGPIGRRAAQSAGPLRSPGLLARHYAPRAALECVAEDRADARVAALVDQGQRVGWLTLADRPASADVVSVCMPLDPAGYGARLYDALHALDAAGVDRIIVTLPPDAEEWLAIHDRLRRAGSP